VVYGQQKSVCEDAFISGPRWQQPLGAFAPRSNSHSGLRHSGTHEPPALFKPLGRAPRCAMENKKASFQTPFIVDPGGNSHSGLRPSGTHEPPALSTSLRRAPRCAMGNKKDVFSDAFYSGPRGIRTPGLLNAIETRSQLRYGPLFNFC
jgi:hypothetical protein